MTTTTEPQQEQQREEDERELDLDVPDEIAGGPAEAVMTGGAE
jgi:hypothetical protein